MWESLAALDRYRHRFEAVPESMTNAVLLGTLLVPRGFTGRRPFRAERSDVRLATGAGRRRPAGSAAARARRVAGSEGDARIAARAAARCRAAAAGPRAAAAAADMLSSPRAKRALMQRGPFAEALTWLEIHGQRAGNRRALARIPRGRGAGRPAGQRPRPRRRGGAAADAGGGADRRAPSTESAGRTRFVPDRRVTVIRCAARTRA